VFARPPVPRREPIQRQVVRAQRKTRAARRRLPPPPRAPYRPPGVVTTVNDTHRVTAAERAAIDRGVRDARLRVLRRRTAQSHRGPDVLAQQFSNWIVKHAVVPSTGGGPTLPNRLVLGRPRTRTATALAPPPYAVRKSPVARSIVRDLALLGTGPFVGGYEIGAAGVEAAQGRTARARRLARGTVTGLRESAPGQLVTGHPGRAAKAFGEHPLLSLLDFAAAESVVGRSAGAVVRAAGKPGPGVRGRLADIGSTARSPLALGHDAAAGVVNQRPYSKSLSPQGRAGVPRLAPPEARG
jgi:hypothetical protein